MKKYYPLFLDIENKKCVVVGGGKVAERKVRALLKCGGKVLVISPVITAGLKRLLGKRLFSYKKDIYKSVYLKGTVLVIAATDDAEVNRRIFSFADKCGILVNVVDKPALCSFIVPAVYRKGPLAIAVSTSGTNPAMAKKIRQGLEKTGKICIR